MIDLENHAYLLEAAADGRVIALGARGLVEPAYAGILTRTACQAQLMQNR